MKLEVGESLVLSWLRHVKSCQIVQTNWKASNGWPISDLPRLEEFVTEISEHFRQRHDVEIFNKGSPSQLIKQGEIDVVGLQRTSDGALSLIAVDIANHDKGLNYGPSDKTISRVLKKFIRSALYAQGYFPGVPAQVVFASPKIGGPVLAPLTDLIGELKNHMAASFSGIELNLICNEHFRSEILHPVMARAGEIADTSELFLRSYQLWQAFDPAAKHVKEAPFSSPMQGMFAEETVGTSEPKIGAHVQERFAALLEHGSLPPDEIRNLQEHSYTKAVFGLNFPFLKKHDSALSAREKQYVINGYGRYYAAPVWIGDERYYLCNQWISRHQGSFDAWVARFNGSAL